MSKITSLGIGIIAFEGLEHIKNIAYELRDFSNHIVICLQEKSYHGDLIEKEDVADAHELLDAGLIDEIIWFAPIDLHEDKGIQAARFVETDKRNYIQEYLETKCGCSHCLIMDSDEYYDHYDFQRAVELLNSKDDVHVTYCQYINYYRDYEHLMVWPFLSYVPFITEAKYRFDFIKGKDNFKHASDPTRRYILTEENSKYHILQFNLIKMHHLSWIRKDIVKKIDSWSAKKMFDRVKGLREAVINRYKNFKDGQNAIIMFGVPEYQVCVNRLDRQYIHPHYCIDEHPVKYVKYES